jgi:phosphoglycolate phosphatase-like HAD superfamily hydrolase
MKYRAVILDFDGTIVESVESKSEGFRALFQHQPEHVEAIIDLHVSQGGRSRYEKFALIYRDILQRTPREGEFAELGERFASLVVDAVVTSPFVCGALAFLEEFATQLPLIVVSGTPQDELLHILDRRRLTRFFAEAHGSPYSKESIVRELLERRAWPPGELLFIGDAMSDFEAASATGLCFVGRVPEGTPSIFPNGTATITDLTELAAIVRQRDHESSHKNGR